MVSVIIGSLIIFSFWWIFIHLILIRYPKDYPFFKYLAIFGVTLFILSGILFTTTQIPFFKWGNIFGFICLMLSFIPCWFWVNCNNPKEINDNLYDYFNPKK